MTTPYLNRLSKHDMSLEYKCLNGLQDTAWKINVPVFEVIRKVWDSGESWGDLPAKHNLPLEEYPFSVSPQELSDEDKIRFKAWSRRRGAVHIFNAQTMSKRVQVERSLQMAEEFIKYPEFYYIWQSDFRGRKYPMSSFMTPQSADYSKALLTFAKGVPINNKEELMWLLIHGANVYGNDKVPITERVNWAWNNVENVKATAADPLGFRWWTEFDKPFQGLAWIFEFNGFLEHGYGFPSHLPCQADGSANGLQHLSAMLRDERGGKAVNLLPLEKPADIYQDVANETIASVKADLTNEDKEKAMLAKLWLEFGIDRSITKRPVMITPYSGTQHACRAYIEETVRDKVAKGKRDVFGDHLFKATVYLASYVWDAIAGVIISARTAMDFIKDLSMKYTEAGVHMEWITPTGFLVQQQYFDQSDHMIKSKIDGNIIKLKMSKEIPDTVNRKRTRLGSSPNFIHSMDASALTFTVNACLDEGIDSFAMVHDSFGTHSANMIKMSDILREEFVKMYICHDVLKELRDHASNVLGTTDLPELPVKGNLNIADVMGSDYFFA